jgi:two-component system sensor histidine kinase TctE
MKSGSLRARLLWWLLLPLGVLWVLDAVHTFLTVRAAINAAYDRSLFASALATEVAGSAAAAAGTSAGPAAFVEATR